MTVYQSIRPKQEPFDNGFDDQGRPVVTFNIDVVKKSSRTFLLELIAILEQAGVGTLNVTIFGSSASSLPPDTDTTPPFLTVIETGGTTPLHNHNELTLPAWPRPSAKLTAHARTPDAANTLAWAAYAALVRIRNIDVVP